jgi:cellobiose epimerase
MSNDLRLKAEAPKGLILNARILWTFSAAFAATRADADARLAARAYAYLAEYFLDREHGGYVWEVAADASQRDGSKKVYGQAFCIYALAEYHRIFHEPRALEAAVAVFRSIESRARDPQRGGYVEVLARNWRPCADVRLSDKDMNEKKSMNNHLHVLEAYANLLRVWPDALLAARLRELIDIFRRHILNSAGTHFNHFFDEAWTPRSDSYTFGHDIEGSWLLCEAADVLGDVHLQTEVRALAAKIARAVLREGVDKDGGLFYEARDGKIINAGKEWWPQAEAVVGFYNAWQITGDSAFRTAATRCWEYIQNHVVDRVHGEWFWRIRPDGTPDPAEPKVSAWKCPYHNARCCLEIIHRARHEDKA